MGSAVRFVRRRRGHDERADRNQQFQSGDHQRMHGGRWIGESCGCCGSSVESPTGSFLPPVLSPSPAGGSVNRTNVTTRTRGRTVRRRKPANYREQNKHEQTAAHGSLDKGEMTRRKRSCCIKRNARANRLRAHTGERNTLFTGSRSVSLGKHRCHVVEMQRADEANTQRSSKRSLRTSQARLRHTKAFADGIGVAYVSGEVLRTPSARTSTINRLSYVGAHKWLWITTICNLTSC